MSVSVNARGVVEACAYSGCWTGRAARIDKTGKYLYATGRFKWSGSTGSRANLAVVIDTKERIGFFMGEGFAHPMTCTP